MTVVFDLTSYPEDWGKDEATNSEIKKYFESEQIPECYCCGHQGEWQESSPLALQKTEYGTMNLFHYDCYVLNRIRYLKEKSKT